MGRRSRFQRRPGVPGHTACRHTDTGLGKSGSKSITGVFKRLGQFLSPLVVTPLADAIGGVRSPYVVATGFAVILLLQVFLTRRHHALPPSSDK